MSRCERRTREHDGRSNFVEHAERAACAKRAVPSAPSAPRRGAPSAPRPAAGSCAAGTSSRRGGRGGANAGGARRVVDASVTNTIVERCSDRSNAAGFA